MRDRHLCKSNVNKMSSRQRLEMEMRLKLIENNSNSLIARHFRSIERDLAREILRPASSFHFPEKTMNERVNESMSWFVVDRRDLRKAVAGGCCCCYHIKLVTSRGRQHFECISA